MCVPYRCIGNLLLTTNWFTLNDQAALDPVINYVPSSGVYELADTVLRNNALDEILLEISFYLS